MPKTRREFSPEFKREAVALLESSDRPLMQMATEVGISPSMLRNWRAAVRGGTVRSGAARPSIPPMRWMPSGSSWTRHPPLRLSSIWRGGTG